MQETSTKPLSKYELSPLLNGGRLDLFHRQDREEVIRMVQGIPMEGMALRWDCALREGCSVDIPCFFQS
jgi:hypothetical protein